MKKLLFPLFLVLFIFYSNRSIAQTIWDGPPMIFEKVAFADFTKEEHQDRITDNVWITRANTQGIFNIKAESSYNMDAPAGTEWAEGTTADIGSLVFTTWVQAINSNPPGSLNTDLVLHLLAEDIYIDIKFTSWGQGTNGGGSFKYTRSTDMVSGLKENEFSRSLSIYPNPCSDYLFIDTDIPNGDYSIYSLADGTLIKQTKVLNSNKINTSDLPSGTYVLLTQSGIVRKFVRW